MDQARRDAAAEHLRSLGERLRLLRVARGLSQERLAHDAGLHRAVGFIERGERDIGVSHLWPLAAALGVSVAELFEEPRPVL